MYCVPCFLTLFFARPICYLRTFISHFPSPDVTQIRGLSAGLCPPSPLQYVPFFYHEHKSALSSLLVDSRRTVLTPTLYMKGLRQFVSLEHEGFRSEI